MGNGSELVEEKLLVVNLSFPHVFSGNPLLYTYLYGCPITAFGHDPTATFREPLQKCN